jgi:hypothetical protein
MTPKVWDEVRELLEEDAKAYVAKWTTWKSAYYAGILSVCGIEIVPALAAGRGEPLLTLSKIASFLAVVAAACVLSNMRFFIRLYDALGFHDVPKDQERYEAYCEYKRQ